jgi:hypothetical protein
MNKSVFVHLVWKTWPQGVADTRDGALGKVAKGSQAAAAAPAAAEL